MRLFSTFLLAAFPMTIVGGEPDYSTPTATVTTYLKATLANDVTAAKQCWTVDDNNATGSLDVVVGMWIASRKLVAVVQSRFGDSGVKTLGRWNRPNATNAAIETTLQRIGNSETKERGDIARLSIPWQTGDGDTKPAFMHAKAPLILRKVGTDWKLDANFFTGVDKAAELFVSGSNWAIWRDEMSVMNDLTTAIAAGELKDLPAFEKELKSRVDVLKAKYAK